ncbi:MAG: M23 family metallopeptidase [Bdellovibrionales bacterium]|nr:M23 family metallopeptidase [Bdellovibrionales bacterium]
MPIRFLLLILISIFSLESQSEVFKPLRLDVFSQRGVKFFEFSSGNQSHKDVYAIPNTQNYKGWQVTQLGSIQGRRTPVQVCMHGAQCYTGWVSSKWVRPSNSQSPIIKPRKNAENMSKTISDNNSNEAPICIGVAQTKKWGLLLRSVHKERGRLKKGEPLQCHMNPGVDLCITDANTATGKRSWVEALITPDNFDKLSRNCQRHLKNAIKDGRTYVNSSGEYVVSFYTNSQYVDTRTGETESFPISSLNTEAKMSECSDCIEPKVIPLAPVTNTTSDIYDITQKIADNSSHPLGWPISADGYSYPLDPSAAYITSEYGVRKLHGRFDFHEGIDFGTNNKIVSFHAMKSGKVILNKMNCDTNSSENCNGGYGNQVRIQHDDGTTMLYSHLHANCVSKVKIGQKVNIGDKLGCVGYSGRGSIHLDVRLLKRGGSLSNISYQSFQTSNKRTVSLRVAKDFIPLESKLQGLYTHFVNKKEYSNYNTFQRDLAARHDYLQSLGVFL